MKNIIRLSSLLLFIIAVSCATNNSKAIDDNSMNRYGNSLEDPTESVDLTTHLSRFAGITVTGSGANAVLLIRGVSSINSGNQPLIILDDIPLSTYADLYYSISPMMIKRIEVLKRPEEIGLYGVRGANGVIKVTTKKTAS